MRLKSVPCAVLAVRIAAHQTAAVTGLERPTERPRPPRRPFAARVSGWWRTGEEERVASSSRAASVQVTSSPLAFRILSLVSTRFREDDLGHWEKLSSRIFDSSLLRRCTNILWFYTIYLSILHYCKCFRHSVTVFSYL